MAVPSEHDDPRPAPNLRHRTLLTSAAQAVRNLDFYVDQQRIDFNVTVDPGFPDGEKPFPLKAGTRTGSSLSHLEAMKGKLGATLTPKLVRFNTLAFLNGGGPFEAKCLGARLWFRLDGLPYSNTNLALFDNDLTILLPGVKAGLTITTDRPYLTGETLFGNSGILAVLRKGVLYPLFYAGNAVQPINDPATCPQYNCPVFPFRPGDGVDVYRADKIDSVSWLHIQVDPTNGRFNVTRSAEPHWTSVHSDHS